jgi:hypothetical protein
MQSVSYLVCLKGCNDPKPFKVFAARADAVAEGQRRLQSDDAEQAVIYEVPETISVDAAIAALENINAKYVQTCTRHASDAEIVAHNTAVDEAARKGGPWELLKHLGLVTGPPPEPKKMLRR